MRRWARLIVRLRLLVIASWIAFAVLATVALPDIRQAQVGALGDLVPRDAAAIDVERRSNELFGFPLLSRTLVVERRPAGLGARRQIDAVRRTVALNRGRFRDVGLIAGGLPVSNTLGRPPFSRESSTTFITYLFFPPDVGQIGRTTLARRFVAGHVDPLPGGFVGITGAIPARYEQARVIGHSLPTVEIATVVVVALAVGLYFGALGVPLVNLLTIGVAYLVSIRVIAWIGEHVGVSVPSEVQPVIVALLFGVVTDYTIFFASRFRRHVEDGTPRREAAERTTAELTPIVLACGLTVVGGSAALAVAKVGFLQAFGPGMAMAVAIALLAALTVVPAALALAGPLLYWPRSPRRGSKTMMARESSRKPLRRRVLEGAVDHPLPVAAACLALLLAAAAGMLRLDLGNGLIRGLPDDSQPRRAYDQAAQGFAPGILSPTVLVVEGRGVVRRRAALDRLQRVLERQPGVAEVVGPSANPARAPFGAILSRTGDAARYVLVLRADPLGSVAIARLRALRARMPTLLDRSGLAGARFGFAGDTALSEETIDESVADLLRVLPAVLAAILLVLVVFLRSLVAPLYLVAVSLLAPLAALGLGAAAFGGELTYFVPIAATVLLVALGSDYNVFLAGRVWHEARDRPLREAVVLAGTAAARAIAAAGVVLAASFALLALVPLRSFHELAFVMVAGLLIDAFLVRTVLVPALISLVGERSGWPWRSLRTAPAP